MRRRSFFRLSALLGVSALFAGKSVAGETTGVSLKDTVGNAVSDVDAMAKHHMEVMSKYADLLAGRKLQIGLLVYPGMFLQDLVGPLTVFESLMHRDIHLLWKNTAILPESNPKAPALIPVKPTTAFQDCPDTLDVLFVPGGVPGTFAMMEDSDVLAFLAAKASSSMYVSSVCTGSLILGAAGLLDGYRATCYWSMRDVLREFGATPVKQRVVVDRNRVTGGGVTSGIDMALTMVAMLRNQTYAEATQLYLEYDPQPPFDAGSPDKANAVVKGFLDDMFVDMNRKALDIALRIKRRG